MPNPWDRPPIPKRGDEHEDITFMHVGRITTRWEFIEVEFSRLYTWFGGKLDDQILMNEYGKGSISRTRTKDLTRKADEFFIKNPDQHRESKFCSLLAQARGYADRRNDIAHGIVFRIDPITFFRERIKATLLKREHYALIPPIYSFRHADVQGFPVYAYTSPEMKRLERRLWRLYKEIEDFRLEG